MLLLTILYVIKGLRLIVLKYVVLLKLLSIYNWKFCARNIYVGIFEIFGLINSLPDQSGNSILAKWLSSTNYALRYIYFKILVHFKFFFCQNVTYALWAPNLICVFKIKLLKLVYHLESERFNNKTPICRESKTLLILQSDK